jgi:xanthine dehydrogenase accessory factor
MRHDETVDVDRRDDTSLPRPSPITADAIHARVAQLVQQGTTTSVATVLARRGSAPATPGQKIILARDMTCCGTVGGGFLEGAVLRAMQRALDTPANTPTVISFHLGPSLGMCCGGSVDVLIEVFAASWAVGIVGAGHVASALVPLLVRVGFSVTVADERDAWADPVRLPDARVLTSHWRVLAEHVSTSGAVVVMTHDHQLDQEAIEWALTQRYALVGGVGSRAKALRTRARLEAKSFSQEDIARIRMPLGVSIGARSPDEIAVSITAELIAWRRNVVVTDSSIAPSVRR